MLQEQDYILQDEKDKSVDNVIYRVSENTITRIFLNFAAMETLFNDMSTSKVAIGGQ